MLSLVFLELLNYGVLMYYNITNDAAHCHCSRRTQS